MALKLSKNRIQRLETYVKLPEECKYLKVLNLSDNDIRSLQELEHVQGMSGVTEVVLSNNPCQDQARDFASYSSTVRRYFPNLEILVSNVQ